MLKDLFVAGGVGDQDGLPLSLFLCHILFVNALRTPICLNEGTKFLHFGLSAILRLGGPCPRSCLTPTFALKKKEKKKENPCDRDTNVRRAVEEKDIGFMI